MAARDQDSQGQAAREEFASRYYRPVHAYLRAIVRDDEESSELTQGFFTDVIASGRLLNRYDRAHGGFRPYLKQALRNYVTSALRARGREKRRPAEEEVRPDQRSSGWAALDLGIHVEPEVAFHEAWVRELLRQALETRERDLRGETTKVITLRCFLAAISARLLILRRGTSWVHHLVSTGKPRVAGPTQWLPISGQCCERC